MRVLVLNWLDRENPQAGGAELHLHQVFGRLVDRGHSVTLVSSGWSGAPRRVRLDGIDVHRVGGRHSYLLSAPAYVASGRAGPFDLVVEDLNKVPLFAPLWTNNPSVLLVHHLFGATAFESASVPVAAATWLLERPVPRVFRAVPVIAISGSTRDDLVDRGMSPGRITVIPNGVDIERYSPDPDRGRFEEPTILYLGRLKRYKGLESVLQALAGLGGGDGSTASRARLVIAGTGDARAELERQAEGLGLEDRVTFEGFVTFERKIELLRRSWVHVLASAKEGWGLTVIEAGSCGTPTVASDSPGLSESVVDGRTGLLVPHGDPDGLRGALERLLNDPDERESMGRAARTFARQFSWERATDRVEGVLRAAWTGGSPDDTFRS